MKAMTLSHKNLNYTYKELLAYINKVSFAFITMFFARHINKMQSDDDDFHVIMPSPESLQTLKTPDRSY